MIRTVRIHEFGGPEVLRIEEIEVEEPGEGEVRMRIRGMARNQSWAFRLVFWIPALFLTLAWYGNIAGPPPSNLSIIGYTSLTFFSLTVGWAYWCNRLRQSVQKVR
jgi:hypothetical protein